MTVSKRCIVNVLRAGVAMFFVPVLLSRCASMMTPTGGPRDTLPPVIVKMTPDNMSTNRPLTKHQPIYIEFNEFVQIKDQQKEFFVSPATKKKPLVSLRGRGIVVQLRDTLEPNTTYSLNFGSSIRDNNENNPLNSMRYVFSTGDAVDSMMMTGYTADAYKADSMSKTFIWFFPADSVEQVAEYDSTIFKYKPRVIARAENNGIFIAQNLKPIDYKVYGVTDANDNQMYEAGVDKVGFVEGVYNPSKMPDFAIWFDSVRQYVTAEPQLYMRMFTDKAFRRQNLSETDRPSQHRANLYFAAAYPRIVKIHFDSLPDESIILEPMTKGRDTVAVWINHPSELIPDSLRGEITYFKHDTLNVLQEVTEPLKLNWRYIESKEEKREREKEEKERKRAEEAGEEYKAPKRPSKFVHKIPTSAEVNPERNLEVSFDYPLAEIDSARLLMTFTDEKENVEDLPVHFVRDTGDLRKWHIISDWSRQGKYTLTIPEGAITDIAGLKNDSLTCNYTALDPDKCAVVKVHISAPEDGRYILQLLDGNNALKEEKRNVRAGDVQFNYVPAGDIKFRIIEDKNGNGEWDSGDVVKRLQPERAEFYANKEGDEVFVSKANWEMELEMNMRQIFAPVTMKSLSRMLDEREMQRLRKEAERRAKERPSKKNRNNEDEMNRINNSMNSTGNMFNKFR